MKPDPTIAELRRFAAELTGRVVRNPEDPLWLQWFTDHTLVDDYRPDSPQAPAWQILGFIEAARERGWLYKQLNNSESDGVVEYSAEFFGELPERYCAIHINPLIAILLAGFRAIKGEK